jgi:2'-5' RNA ligase
MIRLFIAMPLGDQAEQKLSNIIAECREHGGSVKWVRPENIHLTIRFLGDTDESLIEKLKQLIDEVVTEFSPVETTIDQLGAFPNLKRPRVIWTSISSETETLAKLARQVELRVRKLRFEADKKSFKAHLTLGRVRKPQGLDDLLSFLEKYTVEPIPVRFDRLVLFQSTLTPQGSIYKRLHEAVLTEERFGG